MPLIVPILRALFTFLNVFETYKTLKLPPPSRKNGGKPSVRALTQRKRTMKGCLTVWLIWCCFMIYERTVDSVIGLFIPFYSELKSLVILFFLLTRARGAEPIFLHVFRPLIKPYVSTLDACLYVIQSGGDLLFLIISVPIEFFVNRYRYWFSKKPSGNAEAEVLQPAKVDIQSKRPGPQRAESTEYGTTRTRKRTLEGAHAKASVSQAKVPSSMLKPQAKAPEIWYPPPSAYEHEGLPTPPYEEDDSILQAEIQADLEWRKYESFPAAYPPTPLNPNAKLPSTEPESMEIIEEEIAVIEEWRKYEDFPSAYPQTPLTRRKDLSSETPTLSHIQEESMEHESSSEDEGCTTDTHLQRGFRRSPKPPHDPMNPSHAGDFGDDKENVNGVQLLGQSSEEEGVEMDIDSEDEQMKYEEEDSFDVTLRTPFPLSKKGNLSHFSTASADSTGLSTIDDESPFRTRVNSEVPAPVPLAGTKRPFAGIDGEDLAARVRRLESMRAAARSRDRGVPASQANARTPPKRAPRLRMAHSSTSSGKGNTASEKESEREVDDEDSATKKRKVGRDTVQPVRRKEYQKVVEPAIPVSKPAVAGTRIRRTTTGLSRVPSSESRTNVGPKTASGTTKPVVPRNAAPALQPKPKAQIQAVAPRTSRTGKPVRRDGGH